MITIQRVRVQWTPRGRGAPQADARRGLCRPVALPPAPPGSEVFVHEVFAEEDTGYARRDTTAAGGTDQARDLGFALTGAGSTLLVDRIPGWVAYPRQSGPARLFALGPGEVGRFRANLRALYTMCPCNPGWYYEEWVVHVAHGAIPPEGFVSRAPDHDVDHRVSLYGKRR